MSKGINILTPGTAHQSLHFAIALLGTFPPLQNAARRSSWGNQVSQKSHQLIDYSRQLAKKPLTFVLKKAITSYLKHSGVALVDKYSNNIKKEVQSLVPEVPSLNWLFSGRLGSVANEIVEHQTDLIAEQVPVMINKVAGNLAEVAIDQATFYTKRSFEVYFCNQALSLALKTHPVLASMTLIAEGGINQNLRELMLRISGVGVMLLTGSTFWPMLLIHGSHMIDYTITLRGNHLKRQGIVQDPLIEVIKKFIKSSFKFSPSHQTMEVLSTRSDLSKMDKKSHFPKKPFNSLHSTTANPAPVVPVTSPTTPMPIKKSKSLFTPFSFNLQMARTRFNHMPSHSAVPFPTLSQQPVQNTLRMPILGHPFSLPGQATALNRNHLLFTPRAGIMQTKPILPSIFSVLKK